MDATVEYFSNIVRGAVYSESEAQKMTAPRVASVGDQALTIDRDGGLSNGNISQWMKNREQCLSSTNTELPQLTPIFTDKNEKCRLYSPRRAPSSSVVMHMAWPLNEFERAAGERALKTIPPVSCGKRAEMYSGILGSISPKTLYPPLEP